MIGMLGLDSRSSKRVEGYRLSLLILQRMTSTRSFTAAVYRLKQVP